ncbi:MAG: mucoidy inhibitor MuiA family protein [Candidatus Kapabacteria bacterium]|jgi:uncharacterized protein (TIGR02231 family)|nr:mucoidy inhibitor MuiA family protein [Candidatus Kapabacteria bacterium]
MKRLIVLILFSLTVAGNCRANTITIDQSPSNVVFYQKGAVVSYDFTANLKKGTNTIVFKSLPHKTDENSFRMSSDANVIINSVTFDEEKYENVESQELKILRDSSATIDFMLEVIQNKKQVLEGEEKIISSFSLNNNEKSSTAQDLKTHADYYNTRVGEIRTNLLELTKEAKLIKEKKQKLSIEIASINSSASSRQQFRDRYFMNAVLKSEEDKKVNMTFSFFTYRAGWKPIYDIKIDDEYTKLDLTYKAKIWQESGYDWNDVDITVSTRNPSVNGAYKKLTTWYVGHLTTGVSSTSNGFSIRGSRTSETQVRLDGLDIGNQFTGGAGSLFPMVTTNQFSEVSETPVIIDGVNVGTALNTYFSYEYHPKDKYDVKSSKNPQTISLKSEEIECDFEHFIIPSRDTEAYLVAKIPDWSKYSLLPGSAKVYFGNSYVGKTHISTNNADEKLSVSLGKSKGILAERETLKKYTEIKLFSSNIVKKSGYKIKIRNNRSENIKVTVQDQIPVSTHESFQIELLRSDGAKLKKSTGILEWKLDLDPGETVEKIFVFEADIPKGQTLRR